MTITDIIETEELNEKPEKVEKKFQLTKREIIIFDFLERPYFLKLGL